MRISRSDGLARASLSLSSRLAELRLFEQRVRSEVVQYLDFGPSHFFWLIGIFLAAAIASDGYLLR